MIMQVVGATTSCIINRPEKKLTYSLFTIKILDLKEPCKNNWNFEESQSFESRRIIESRIQLYDILTTSDWMSVSSIQMKSLTSVLYG